jgi:hypothetical protein
VWGREDAKERFMPSSKNVRRKREKERKEKES